MAFIGVGAIFTFSMLVTYERNYNAYFVEGKGAGRGGVAANGTVLAYYVVSIVVVTLVSITGEWSPFDGTTTPIPQVLGLVVYFIGRCLLALFFIFNVLVKLLTKKAALKPVYYFAAGGSLLFLISLLPMSSSSDAFNWPMILGWFMIPPCAAACYTTAKDILNAENTSLVAGRV